MVLSLFLYFEIVLPGLQVSILMYHILDARTCLLWIKVMMTYYYRARVAPVQVLKQSSHGCLLSLGAGVGGLTADVQPALIADAYRVGIVVLAVGTDHPLGSSMLNRSVTTDNVVVAYTELPALAAMPRVNLSSRDFCRTPGGVIFRSFR